VALARRAASSSSRTVMTAAAGPNVSSVMAGSLYDKLTATRPTTALPM
jgi:hypothetical protein